MQIIFLGTPQYAIPSLQALLNAKYTISLVITPPNKPAGRGKKLASPIVKTFAEENNLQIIQTPNISKDTNLIQTIQELKPDLMITAAFGQILSPELLSIPKYGIWNVHASLLPRWRGAAPIQWSIISGDVQTGVTIMQTEKGLDTGDILIQKSLNILKSDSTGSLMDKLSYLGADALIEAIQSRDILTPLKQNPDMATYASKITKDMTIINWSENAIDIYRKLKAFTPFAYMTGQVGKHTIKIIEATYDSDVNIKQPGDIIKANKQSGIQIQCGSGALTITTLQPPGKNKMPAQNWLNGISLPVT